MGKTIINKAFFGKSNCLKVTLSEERDLYLHFGVPMNGNTKQGDEWIWKKVKMNDDELGDIINVLEHRKDSISFFHEFHGDKTSININRKEQFLFIKAKDITKSLSEAEQRVLLELLRYAILRMNMSL